MTTTTHSRSDWRVVIVVVAPLYLTALIYLLFLGEWMDVGLMLANTLFISLLAWLTVRLTRPMPPEPEAASHSRGRLWAQLAVLAAIILITWVGGDNVPLWSGMIARLRSLGEAVLPVEWFGGPGNAVANPVQYFVIPLILLLVLGAKPRDLGLGRGHRVWRVSLLWAAAGGVILILPTAAGALSLRTFVGRVISNSFQNGFFEEFLFRGALQTRLHLFLSTPWTLVIQALLFGLWHLRSNTLAFNGNIVAGLAWCIISQGVLGFIFGVIFHRTRNLIAPSVAHVMMNVVGQSFG